MHDLLKFRRQFLMANELIDDLNSWKHQQIDKIHLYAHPDLEVTSKEGPTSLVILIGYIFNPAKPGSTNRDIISEVALKVSSFDDLIAAVKPYTGRYVIIYRDDNRFNILHDALGLREVFYSTQPNKVVCGSQPNLLARFSKPEIKKSSDREVMDFVQNHLPRVRNGRLWPGDGTPYEAVKHLLPNHYLDIVSLESCRYWPNQPLTRIELDEAVRGCSSFLQGALQAAAQRQTLMLAVTAGEDSRALLAASRKMSNSIYYFINKVGALNDQSGDIKIPREIFRRLGIPFHIQDIPKGVPEEFRQIFLDNAFYAKEEQLSVIYNIYFKQHNEKINILGVGEIGRTKFFDEPKKLTPYYLAYMLKHRKSAYAVKECLAWLQEAEPIARRYDLNIMTLFWWEVLIGCWGPVGNSESDIAIEEFDPYDSHYLYEMFLSVDAKYRTFRDNILFEELIRYMWPQLLDVPINPPGSFYGWVIFLFHKLGIEKILRSLKFRIYSFCYRLCWKYKTHKC